MHKNNDGPTEPNRGGRPRALEIGDFDVHRQIHELAQIFCTKAEAAGVLGVSIRTLERYFVMDGTAYEEWEQGQNSGKASLRRTQFRLAERSAAMAIFLGKQYLGQKDIAENRVFLKKLEDMTEAEIVELLGEQVADDDGSGDVEGTRALEAPKPGPGTTH